MKMRVVLRVSGLVLSLHGLTTAHYKAREPSSVKAAAGWLFIAFSKKVESTLALHRAIA